MLYEGIYQACSLKEVKIKDIAGRKEKYCHRDSGGRIVVLVIGARVTFQ